MISELGLGDRLDSYWRSLSYIFAGDITLFNHRKRLINFENESIKIGWLENDFSGGEFRLLALAFHLFTNNDYYTFENESEDEKRYYFTPINIFSGLDVTNYQLAKNALDIRMNLGKVPRE